MRIEDRESVQWRLVTPTGGVTWAHSGHVGSRELADALDDYLFRSPPPAMLHVTDAPLSGVRVPGYAFESDVIGRLARLDEGCPPPPFERLGLETAVKFIRKNSLSSEAALRAMTDESDPSASEEFRVIVLDGGSREDEERMRDILPDAMIIADTDGVIAKRFGVHSWPSDIRISRSGIIAEAEASHHE